MPSSTDEAEDASDTNHARQRPTAQRRSSVSEALSKFTTGTFNRKRSGGLPGSTSTASINQQSRLPTPSGIPRSSSFFSNLNAFATKSASSVSGSEVTPQPLPVKRSRRISDRLAQTPFFSLSNQHQDQSQDRQSLLPAPVTPKTRQASAVKIEQHGLMQPIHPPLPRSATMGNFSHGPGQQSSPRTPSYMRPTSSSAARRGSLTSPRERNAPISTMPTIDSRDTPSMTPTTQTTVPMPTTALHGSSSRTPTNQYGYRAPTQKYPIRKDSLLPAQASAGLSVARKERSPSPPNVAGLSYSRFNSFSGESFRASTNPMSANAAGKQPMALNMAVSNSDRQDSGVAFAGDEEVQRRFDENVQRTTVLPSTDNDPHHILQAFNFADDDDSYEGFHDSEEENKLCRVERCSTPEPNQHADRSDERQVFEAQGPIWWLGRYTAVHDHFRNSALPTPQGSSNMPDLTLPSPALSFSSTDSLIQPMHDDARRTRRVYAHLRSLCMTEEAKQSLDEFKVIMDARERKIAEGGGKLGPKIREKKGFFQGLMGKKKGEGSGK